MDSVAQQLRVHGACAALKMRVWLRCAASASRARDCGARCRCRAARSDSRSRPGHTNAVSNRVCEPFYFPTTTYRVAAALELDRWDALRLPERRSSSRCASAHARDEHGRVERLRWRIELLNECLRRCCCVNAARSRPLVLEAPLMQQRIDDDVLPARRALEDLDKPIGSLVFDAGCQRTQSSHSATSTAAAFAEGIATGRTYLVPAAARAPS